jgi:hypothetical protein
MHSFQARTAASHYTAGIHPALTSVADEVCGTLARLIAYLCMLALIAMAGVYLWDQMPAADLDPEPAARAGWSTPNRSVPAFAVSQFDLAYKTDTYQILRHPEGGRKDVLRWTGPDGKPAAELEIYRPGGELAEAMPAMAEIAGRIDPDGFGQIEAAGIIDSKFGAVTLLRLIGDADGNRSCLGFLKRLDQPNLRLSGWSCQGDSLPARRTAIACTLNRLMLLTAGNDPKLAELFADAELRRGDCAVASAPALSADWVTASDNPRLRGAF